MQPLFVTLVERSLDAAIDRARELPADVGLELRVDQLDRSLSSEALRSFRERVPQQLMYTRRSVGGEGKASATELLSALDAGFDLVDVEVDPEDPVLPGALDSKLPRMILSHHDYEGVPDDLGRLAAALGAIGTFKIAATPRTLAENLRLLESQRLHAGRSAIFGMGADGLYSRTLSPAVGGILAFAAASSESTGAPGQLPLSQMRAVIPAVGSERPRHLFAITGHPVAHSLSPCIHNSLFQSFGAAAVYGYLDTCAFEDVIEAMRAGHELAPRGISVTSPFKELAFELMSALGAKVTPRAAASGAVNTIVRSDNGQFTAANTDVDGLLELIRSVIGPDEARRPVLIVGAGGTARAAAVAVRELSLHAVVANRTLAKAEVVSRICGGRAIPLSDAGAIDPSLIIDTLPHSAGWSAADVARRTRATLISADYSVGRREYSQLANEDVRILDGRDLLRAQAAAQAQMFLSACGIELDTPPAIPEASC